MARPSRRTMLAGMGGLLAVPALGRAAAREAPRVTIRANRSSGTAPLGLFLEAEATGFGVARPLHDLRYVWDFDDPGIWEALSPDNPHGRARGTAYGPWCVHSFAAPGRYSVTCTVTDGTTEASARITILVRDPDRVYFRETHAVSRRRDFAGAPRGARWHDSIASAMRALGSGGRLLLRAGETFDVAEFGRIGASLHLDRFGAGPRPVLRTERGPLMLKEVPGAVTIANMDIRGPYDPRTGLGAQPVGLTLISAPVPVTVHGCRFSGHGVSIYPGNFLGGAMPELVIADTVCTDFGDFGMLLADADRAGLVGSVLAHGRGTVTGPGGRRDEEGPDWTDHGPLRLAGTMGRVTIHHCEFFSRAGWSAQSEVPGSAHQQCIRWNSGGVAGARGMIERCVLEGGWTMLNAFSNAGARTNRPGDLIVEKSYFLASANTTYGMLVGFGGTTVRNNIFVCPDVPHEYSFYRRAVQWADGRFGNAGGSAENARHPVEIRNNAFVDLRSTGETRARPPLEDVSGPGLTARVRNNLVHAPALPEPVTPHAPVETAPALFAPRYAGRRHADTGFDPAFATPAGTPASFRPLPGSPAIGAAVPPVPPDDFEGTLRRGPTAIGPFHAAPGPGTRS